MVGKRLKLLGISLALLGLITAAYANFVYDITTAAASYAKMDEVFERNKGVDNHSPFDERQASITDLTSHYSELADEVKNATIDHNRLSNQYWMFGLSITLVLLAIFSFAGGVRIANREEDEFWDSEQ